ncbi:MAG: DUF421 domain-containing protein, partial [Oscillospiraceae bacterium]|nr:DUF421 domain-containing protein [Oscillospiraceae bacterium]
QEMPTVRKDLNLNNDNTSLPHILISDGVLIDSEMKKMNFGKKKLEKELKKHGVSSYRDVFLMQTDENGRTLVVPKEKKR